MINSLIPHILCNVSSKKLVSKKSLKVNCNKKSVSSKNRNTLDIRKGQFFNNPPSLYVKGSKEEGRSGTRLSIPIEASIGPWIFLSKDSVETSGSFLPPPVSRRSITTVLYLSGGGHRDRLSTSNQRRVEDKRAKKSWSKNRGGDAGLLLFSIRYFKRKQIVLLLLLLRSSSPRLTHDLPSTRFSQHSAFFLGDRLDSSACYASVR